MKFMNFFKINSNLIKKNNTGSSFYQINILNNRISNLQKHLSFYKKDFHSRIGLFKLISKRYKLIKYVKLNNIKYEK